MRVGSIDAMSAVEKESIWPRKTRSTPAEPADLPQQHEPSSQELLELAERESQSLLGVSWEDARRMLEAGEIAGTAAEAELRMLSFLMGS